MSGDWKPGDVGVDHLERRVLYVGGGHWVTPCGDTWHIDPRPLVVIDPEDRDQIEQLAIRQQDFYYESGSTPTEWSDLSSDQRAAIVDSTQAALREFAAPTPPKPDEPTGLGAVVEDANGNPWIRHGDGPRPWMLAGASPGNRDTYPYSEITTVRVLSEGVTP